jgi:hypothetical protein
MKFTDKITIPGAPGQIDENGFLRLRKVRLGRIGIQQYLGKELPKHLGFQDEEVVNVYRPEEEVFADESLNTLPGLPVTVEHEWKTPDNNDSSGSVYSTPVRDGNDIVGQLLITDGKAISPIQEKKLSDISLGYQADIEKANGFFDGTPYQAIQKNIRYNHVAILRPGGGRAGDKIKIEDKQMPENLITVDTGYGDVQVTQDSKASLKKLMDACAAGAKERDKLTDDNEQLKAKVTDYDSVKSQLEDAKKSKDKMEGELKAKEKELEDADNPEELEKKAKELNDAQTVGRAIMGDKMPKGVGASALRLEIAKHYARENGIVGDSEEKSNDFYDGIFKVAAKQAEGKGPVKKVPGSEIFTDHKVSDARTNFMNDLTGQGGK